MAMSGNGLASELEAAIRDSFELGATPYPKLSTFCDRLANTLVDHIKNNAEVTAIVTGRTSSSPDGTPPTEYIVNQPVTGSIE